MKDFEYQRPLEKRYNVLTGLIRDVAITIDNQYIVQILAEIPENSRGHREQNLLALKALDAVSKESADAIRQIIQEYDSIGYGDDRVRKLRSGADYYGVQSEEHESQSQ